MTESITLPGAQKTHSGSVFTQLQFKLRQYGLNHYDAFCQSVYELRKTQLGTLLTFLMIGVSMALPMGLWTAVHSLKGLTGGLSHNAQMSLFLKMDITPDQTQNLMEVLQHNPDLNAIQYISPEQGLREFGDRIGLQGLSDSLQTNPLPGVITVEPKLAGQNSESLAKMTAFLKTLPGVDSAMLDFKWLNRLYSILAIGQRVVYALSILLGVGVLLVVLNAIRYLIQRYHKQIQIYQLVGATDAYIRRPFVYMGLQYGFWGGLLAWMMDNFILFSLTPSIRSLADSYGVNFQAPYLGLGPLVVLVCLGGALGALGGYWALSSFLRSQERV